MKPNACLSICIRFCQAMPVIFIMTAIIWSYYAYVIEMCLNNVDIIAKRVIYLLFYHILLIMLLWSYIKTILVSNKIPDKDFFLSQADIYELEIQQNDVTRKSILEKQAQGLHLLTRTPNGGFRFCDKCKCIKPDRAHHCSMCQTCILKMDHHCPWVNNCVGFANYKYFILFLAYGSLYCAFIAATSLEYFIAFWSQIQNFQPGRFHLMFMFFLSIMFAVSILFLLIYHFYLISRNNTTLESFRPSIFAATNSPDKDGFNLGRKENFKQVFGNNCLLALLPVFTSKNDGTRFESVKYDKTVELGGRSPPLLKHKSSITIINHIGSGTMPYMITVSQHSLNKIHQQQVPPPAAPKTPVESTANKKTGLASLLPSLLNKSKDDGGRSKPQQPQLSTVYSVEAPPPASTEVPAIADDKSSQTSNSISNYFDAAEQNQQTLEEQREQQHNLNRINTILYARRNAPKSITLTTAPPPPAPAPAPPVQRHLAVFDDKKRRRSSPKPASAQNISTDLLLKNTIKSLSDGIRFPTSTRQTLAAHALQQQQQQQQQQHQQGVQQSSSSSSLANGGTGHRYQTEALLLNERAPSYNVRSSQS